MTGADYDSMRRLLGLSVSEAAIFHGVADRSIRYWGVGGPPAGAVVELARLSELEATTRARIVSEASERPMARLLRYASATDLESAEGDAMPLGCHAMMIAKAAVELRAAGVAVEVEWAS